MFGEDNDDCGIVNGEEVCVAGALTNGYFLRDIEPIVYYAFVVLFVNQINNEF